MSAVGDHCPTRRSLKLTSYAKIDRLRPAFGETSIDGASRVDVLLHELYRLCALSIAGPIMTFNDFMWQVRVLPSYLSLNRMLKSCSNDVQGPYHHNQQ